MLIPSETADFAIDAMTHKANTPWRRDLLLALPAGAFIGIGFVFYLVTQQGAQTMPLGVAKLLGGTHATGTFGAVALATAHAKVSHTFVQTLVLGILCNFLVCIAVWVSFSGRTVADKILAVTLPIAMFVAAGFEHSVANMFLLPYATLLKTFAPPEFWSAAGLAARTSRTSRGRG